MANQYEKDISIDSSNLYKEWEQQPALFLHYSQEYVQLSEVRDREKIRLEQVEAELDKDIRSNSDKYDIPKITESVVHNTIILNEKYKRQLDTYIQSKYEVDTLSNVLKSFDHKKKALENLVQLHMSGYNSTPSETKARENVGLSEARKREKKRK